MALSQAELLTLGGVLVILFAVIVFNNVQAARVRAAARAPGSPSASKPSASAFPASSGPVDPLLVKFARHEGSVVGETVALDGDRLILKQAGMFKAVPRAQAEVQGDDVILTGHIDWVQAAHEGAAWHASHRADAIPEVSGALTRSEDVKSPAMASTRDRQD